MVDVQEFAYQRDRDPLKQQKSLGGISPIFVPGAEIVASAFKPYLNGLINIPDGSRWRVKGMHRPGEDAAYNLPVQVDNEHWRIRLQRVDDPEKPGRWTPNLIAVTPAELGAHFEAQAESRRPEISGPTAEFYSGPSSRPPAADLVYADSDEPPLEGRAPSMPGEALPPGRYEDPNEPDWLYPPEDSTPPPPRPSANRPTVGPPAPRQASWRGAPSTREAERVAVWTAINFEAEAARWRNSAHREAAAFSLDGPPSVKHERADPLQPLYAIKVVGNRRRASNEADNDGLCGVYATEERLVSMGFRFANDGLWLGPASPSKKGTVRLVARRVR